MTNTVKESRPTGSIRRFRVAHDLILVGETWGETEQRPVLLLHGGGQTRHAWADTAADLAAQGWYAVSLDLRGHGDSDWSDDGAYPLDDFAGDVAEIAGQMPSPPVLIGASLGGLASLVAVGEPRFSVAARALVLVDIATRIEPAGVDRITEFMSAYPEGFARLEEAADAVAAYLPGRSRPRDLEGLRKNLRVAPDGRWRWHWDPRFLTGTMPEERRLESAARNLRLPTLLVRGRMSDMLSAEGAQAFRKLVAHARFADVAEAGHMVAGDRNSLFSHAVIEFLSGL
jgi:pimeloyl-ACP methyl ester carboxylesterase